jgi:hypothetical protein
LLLTAPAAAQGRPEREVAPGLGGTQLAAEHPLSTKAKEPGWTTPITNDLQVLNQGINTDMESIAPPRSFGPECYDVTTARTIPDADFQAVTPDAKDKSRFVLVDAVGVTARGIEYLFDNLPQLRHDVLRGSGPQPTDEAGMSDDGGWREAGSRSWVDDLLESDPRIRAKIDEWWATTTREPMVGSRHHTVPRSYLGRFSKAGQLYVRDRVTGAGGLRNTKDTGAIKTFTPLSISTGSGMAASSASSPMLRAASTPCSSAFSTRSYSPGPWIRTNICPSASSWPSSWCARRGTVGNSSSWATT